MNYSNSLTGGTGLFNISVIVNTIAVLICSLIGLASGKVLKEQYRKLIFNIIGLFTIGLGIKMFLDVKNSLAVLGSLIIGSLIGNRVNVEGRIAGLMKNKDANYIKGFITATLLFVAGPMTVIGSIQAGILGNNDIIFVKSLMDGISSIMLAASFGSGVLLTAGSIYVVQGLLVTFSGSISFLQQGAYMNDFSGVGGLMLLGLGLSLLEIKEIRIGNLLPALLLSPFLTYIFGLFD